MFSYDCEEGKDVSVNLNQNVMVKQDDENKIEKKNVQYMYLNLSTIEKCLLQKNKKNIICARKCSSICF